MTQVDDVTISRAITQTYHERLLSCLTSDVLVVGAGPSGLTAAILLARKGYKVTILEKRLTPGGGVWGGGMGMNFVALQQEVLPLLETLGFRGDHQRFGDLYAVDAVELAAGLCYHAVRAGATMFNLLTVEDICVRGARLEGVVVNRTMISGALHVDPIVFTAPAVLDATGHEAVLVQALRKRRLLAEAANIAPDFGEGPMDAAQGEKFVVEHAGQIFPGLWVSGMSVSAALGGPRMGPIFGGMLLSGERVANLIAAALPAARAKS